MESYWPADVSNDRKRAIDVLIRGREFTKQLHHAIIQQAPGADDLVVKILESVNETLSILKMTSIESIIEVPQELAGNLDGKRSASKDRRGCYKRRTTSETWKRETSILIDDGHAWRKYGQKLILDGKHPRNYFRCTYKFDQRCHATKQVQKIQDDPPRYLTTYYGRHTCKNLLKSPQIILASTEEDSPVLLSFESNNPRKNQYGPSPLSFPSAKHETEEVLQSLCHNKLSPSDYFPSPDLKTFETFEPMTALLSASDQGDVISSGVYSCKAPTFCWEMEMFMNPVDFGDIF